jgi:predicted nucleic acid-binding protein
MIYLDTSVVIAELLAEDRRPREALWEETLVSSRLLEYEVWARIHGRRLARSHGDAARALVDRIALVELVSPVLSRALEPFRIRFVRLMRCILPAPTSCGSASQRSDSQPTMLDSAPRPR